MQPDSRFPELVRHFFGRFFDKESLSPEGEASAGVIQTLGILAAPSAFLGILVMPLTFHGWDLVAFRFVFAAYSMVVMGFVIVFEWDALFPDRRDYQVLMPLPLRLSTLFLAKAAALAIFLAMFLLDVNFFGVLFWPGIEGGHDSFPAIMGAHLAAVTAGGLFMALAVAALQGILVTVFRGAAYRRISVAVQTVLMALLVMLLFLTPLLGVSMERLMHTGNPILHWFPCFWFAGFYEQLRPALTAASRAADHKALCGLGTLATRGLWCAVGLFLLTFLPGYRRHARRVLEAPEPSPSGPGRLRRAVSSALDRWLLPDPVERGVFHYITQTITRSPKHRMFLAIYGGFGAALAAMTWMSGSGRSLEFPFTLSFVLISGLRAAFNFPAELGANWAFQVSESGAAAPYLRAARKWVAAFGIVPLFALLAAADLLRFRWTESLFHFGFGLLASLLLLEVMFLGFRKIPFTCARLPGKWNLTFLGVLYLFGFTAYSRTMAGLEGILMSNPPVAFGFLTMAAPLMWLGWWRRRSWLRIPEGQAALEFEEPGDPAVRTLGLSAE